MPTENGQSRDSRLRFRLQPGTRLERTVSALKAEGRDREKQKLEAAVCGFWAPYAYQDSDEFEEIALQSILDLSDQILEIALLANLPVDQIDPMGLKARTVSLKQKRKAQNSGSEHSNSVGTAKPTETKLLTPSNARPKATPTPKKPERESLFDDD